MSGISRSTPLAFACLVTLAGCAPLELGDEEDAQAQVQALAYGVQGMARIDADGNVVPGSAYTTLGTTIEATRTSAGYYTVVFHSLGASSPTKAGQGGTLQVTAVGPDVTRCNLARDWTFTADNDVVARVVCRSPGGTVDSGFYVSYGRGPGPGRAAYARVNADGSVASATSWTSNGGAVTVTHPETGRYWVDISVEMREAVEVTAISGTSYCNVGRRGGHVITVHCFNRYATPIDAAFTINVAGTNGIGANGIGAFAQITADGTLDTRYDFNACPLGTTSARRVGIGRYTVSHTLLGESGESYHVSSYGGSGFTSAGWCKIADIMPPGAGTTATVTAQCFGFTGAIADLGLVESYSVASSDCGGCPRSCQGGTCLLGVCQPFSLVSGPGIGPRSVGANASTVWFTNDPGSVETGAIVLSVPRIGGATTALATLEGIGHHAIADSMLVGSSYVYWYEAASSGGGVFRKPLAGGSRSLLAAGGRDPQPRALSQLGSALYFADASANQVFRISSAGIRTPLLFPSFLSAPSYRPFNLATDASRIYFVKDTGSVVYRVALAGGVPNGLSDPTLSTPEPGLATSAIVTDGIHVYFATSQAVGNIFQVPVAGGTTSVFASTDGVVTGLAIEGGVLFWTVKSPGAVQSRLLTGGPISTLASSENAPSSIFVDASSIFWTNADAVRKLAR